MSTAKAQKRAIIRRLIANRAKASRKTSNGVEPSLAVEVRYRGELLGLVKSVESEIREQVFPVLVDRQSEYIQDENISEILAIAFEGMKAQFQQLNLLYARMANNMVDQENHHHRAAFAEDVERTIGVSVTHLLNEEQLGPTLSAAVRNNVQLIKSIPAQLLDQVETLVMQGIGGGKSAPNIREELEKRFDVAESRARLIARDQVAKLSGNLSRGRQDQIGVTEYVWRTSKDERVRDTHRKKSGRKFRWNEPPSDTGHPGEDVQCRCVAEPVFDHLLT